MSYIILRKLLYYFLFKELKRFFSNDSKIAVYDTIIITEVLYGFEAEALTLCDEILNVQKEVVTGDMQMDIR